MQTPKLARTFFSEGDLAEVVERPNIHVTSKSEPNLSVSKRHPLLDESDETAPTNYSDFFIAAQTLESIVNDGSFIGGLRSKFKLYSSRKATGRSMGDRFLDSLGLVKVLLYDLMKFNFDLKLYPGIDFEIPNGDNIDIQYEQQCVNLLKDLLETIMEFRIKFSAAYARIRIDRQASGDSIKEQLENILPESVRTKEDMAIEMPKTLRINSLKTSKVEVAKELNALNYIVHMGTFRQIPEEYTGRESDLIYVDDDFDDLLVIPSQYFADISKSNLVATGKLIFQDKSSMYSTKQISTFVKKGDYIIDTRAGCGTKIAKLSELVGANGRVFAFENRPAHLGTLKAHLELYGYVIVMEEDFVTTDPQNIIFEKVKIIIVEPLNSGTTIVDKLGYMLQEEEYPVNHLSQKDIFMLKRQQISILKHAFKFQAVKDIIYTTRSIHSEENEQVVEEVLDRYGVQWKLNCVLPDIPNDGAENSNFEECLYISPSQEKGNGIFLTHFAKKPPKTEVASKNVIQHIKNGSKMEQENAEEAKSIALAKKATKSRKKGELLKINLPKSVLKTVERLSKPRLSISTQGQSLERISQTKVKETVAVDFNDSTTTLAEADLKSFTKKDNIIIYGMSLKKFYDPKKLALETLKRHDSLIQPRWVYPVPNPFKWK